MQILIRLKALIKQDPEREPVRGYWERVRHAAIRELPTWIVVIGFSSSRKFPTSIVN